MDPEPYSLLYILASFQNIFPFGIVISLLVFSGLISGSEVAFFSLSKKDLEDNREAYPEHIDKIQSLLRDKKGLLSTILILNNFVNIALVVYVSTLTNVMEFPSYTLFNTIIISGEVVELIFNLGLVTFLILLFGEIIPKVYAQNNPLSVAIKMVGPISQFKKWLRPINKPLIAMTRFLEKSFKPESFSVDQLSQAIELTSEDASTSQDEQKILEGIVSFGNSQAREIMTPRVDMFALEKETPFVDVIEKIKEFGYSRIPVYSKNEDEICGILFAKDLIKYIDKTHFDWLTVIKKPYFIPESKKLDDLLSDIQSTKNHMAIVVDEYGGTSGLVTLEDIIEEIVGEISDEFDDEDLRYTKIDDQTYVFEGKTTLKDFLRTINVENEPLFDEAKGDAETIAGFILEQIDGFPKRNQTLTFHNYVFTIESLTRKRIKRIKVQINKPESDE